MRLASVLFCVVTFCSFGFAEQPSAPATFQWQEPFQVSASSQDASLTVLVITDDAAFGLDEADPKRGVPIPWCEVAFQSSFRELLRRRPDLQQTCSVELLTAGQPKCLTGNRHRTLPKRAMVLVLNQDDQLLSLAVGVPDDEALLTLIEDAQETVSLVANHADDTHALTLEIVDRVQTRVTRHWNRTVDAILKDRQLVPNPDEKILVTDPNRLRRFDLLAAKLHARYQADVRLRFGQDVLLDAHRLAAMEQHPETRRPWCQTMLPFVVGTDAEQVWRLLAEVIWNVAPVAESDSADDLLLWWDQMAKTSPVVLEVERPLLAARQPWPPIDSSNVGAKRGLGWPDLQLRLDEFPTGRVTAAELSVLMRLRLDQSLDLLYPSPTRYVFFESDTSAPFAIRERDVPAKHIARIKRLLKRQSSDRRVNQP